MSLTELCGRPSSTDQVSKCCCAADAAGQQQMASHGQIRVRRGTEVRWPNGGAPRTQPMTGPKSSRLRLRTIRMATSPRRFKRPFLVLVLAQTAHSIEEYV